MRMAVVDDTASEREKLAGFIEQECLERHLTCTVDTFESAEAFLSSFESGKYDTVFLDIYMPGLTGMEAAQKLRETDTACIIIFCTTSIEHAIQSYRVHAFDYLLKPYTDEQLHDTFSACLHAIKNLSAFIEIKSGWETAKIMLDSIVFTDYYNHYIQIHTNDGVIKSHMPFNEFFEMLDEYPQFLCCYRNCMINMDKVSSIDDRDFIMTSGERVPIARVNKSEIKKQYAEYTFAKLRGGG